MRFAGVDVQDMGPVTIGQIQVIDGGTLPPVRRSGERAEDQHDRLLAEQFGKGVGDAMDIQQSEFDRRFADPRAGVAVAVPVSTGAALVGDALAGGGVCVSTAACPQAPRARPRQTTIRMGRLYVGCMGYLSFAEIILRGCQRPVNLW